MKVRCPLCGQTFVRKHMVIIPRVYSNGKVMRVCKKCEGLPETAHKKLYDEEYLKRKESLNALG